MLSSSDLEEAVSSGVLSEDVANRLRSFSAQRRGAPSADEEHFGLVGGLADIMTAMGLLLLTGTMLVVMTMVSPLLAAPIAATVWALAEHFTRKRRLTLTSFVLFGLFALACAMVCLGAALVLGEAGTFGLSDAPSTPAALPPIVGLVVAAGSLLACAAWWVRFDLPIAYAAATLAAINLIVHCLRMVVPEVPAMAVSIFLLANGLVILAIALWWDLSDIRRETRRADIAFWLHAMAGFQIAGSSFRIIFGVTGDPTGWERLYVFATLPPDSGTTALALLLFFCFTLFALAIDRRSLLMSSLAYVVPALMVGLPGMAALPVGLMLLGGLLLSLSAFWTPLRTFILAMLPRSVCAQLPRTSITHYWPRPVR